MLTLRFAGIISLGGSTGPPPPLSVSSPPDEQLIMSTITKNKLIGKL
jgi:hypothetical protein